MSNVQIIVNGDDTPIIIEVCEQGPAGPTGPQGQSFAWRGDWDEAETYAPYDVVRHGLASYVALLASTGASPDSSPAEWDVFVEPHSFDEGDFTVSEDGGVALNPARVAALLGEADDAAAARDVTTLNAAGAHSDERDTQTLDAARTYTDAREAAAVAAANTHADDGDASKLAEAKAYADTGDGLTLGSANAHADAGDEQTLLDANAHADAGDASLAAQIATKASLANPTFSGAVGVPTLPLNTNDGRAASTSFVQRLMLSVINGAPGALDQLNELAAALGNDPNFASTTLSQLATKAARSQNLGDLSDLNVAWQNLTGDARVDARIAASPVATPTVKGLMSAADKLWADALRSLATKTADYTATDTDGSLDFDPTAAGLLRAGLPTAVGRAGKLITFRHSGSTGVVAVKPLGAETVNGHRRFFLRRFGEWVSVQSDGTNWRIYNTNSPGYLHTVLDKLASYFPLGATSAAVDQAQGKDLVAFGAPPVAHHREQVGLVERDALLHPRL
jgi:hypothetical protein